MFSRHLIDDKNLARLREFTILKSEALFTRDFKNLLEIGPPRTSGALNSPIFEKNPQWYVSIENLCRDYNVVYSSLDLDYTAKPTYCGSIDDPKLLLSFSRLTKFERVVAFSILEHVNNPFVAISNMRKMLSVGGELHLLTPWDLRFHGPRPDCWRISDDGYRSLLAPHFTIMQMDFLEQSHRPLSPVAIYVVAKRDS